MTCWSMPSLIVAEEPENPDSEHARRRDRCGLDRGGLRAVPGEGKELVARGVARGRHQV